MTCPENEASGRVLDFLQRLESRVRTAYQERVAII
jgi:hypothetical protein